MNIKITELPVGIDPSGGNLIPVVQGGETRKVELEALKMYLFAGASITGDVDGTLATTSVVALRGCPISNVMPQSGEALIWNGSLWTPTSITDLAVSGDIEGTLDNVTVFRLQGRTVSGAAPTTGQALVWDGSQWAPATITVSNSLSGDVTGTTSANTVTKIQGRAVANTAPNIGQVLKYDGSQWAVVDDISLTQGGNTFGTVVIVGTNDNFGLQFVTGGEAAGSFLASAGRPLVIGSALTANTTTETTRMFVQNDATSSTQAGFGSNIQFNLRSSTTSTQNAAQFAVRWVVSSHASRTSNVVIRGVNNAGAQSDWLTIGPTVAAGTVGIRIAGGTTEYRNASINPGTAFTIGGNAQDVLIGQSTGTVSIVSTVNSGNCITISATAVGGSVRIGSGSYNPTSGIRGGFVFLETFNPTSGNAEFRGVNFGCTINQTGTASGITSFLHIEPNIVAAPNWRAVRILSNVGRGISQEGANANNYFAGKVNVGSEVFDPGVLFRVDGVGGVLLPRLETTERNTIASFDEALLIYNLDEGRYQFLDAASDWSSLAVYERDIKGSENLITSNSHIAIGNYTFTRFDANTNSIDVELGGQLYEGVIYTYRCTRNTANTVTFNAAAGYLLAIDGESTLTPTQLITGGGGTGIRAPHKIYTVRRIGGNIYIS